ncbi:MAG: hypothetical protein ACRC2T_00305 [Thermoguttaceae bacterium]
MKRKWKTPNLTPAQIAWREDRWIEFIPEADGTESIVNGCVPMDDYSESVLAELAADAVSFGTIWEAGDMPVLKYDTAFTDWRQKQIAENKTLRDERITCTLPWEVLKNTAPERKKSSRLYFSQGGLGSCCGHAFAFAWHSSLLQLIARGAPLVYTSHNPVVTWSITKNGSIRGGQSISEGAKGVNLIGNFPEELVGTNNQSVPEYKKYIEEAKRYQSAILFLNFKGKELADEIIKCCAAGLSVVIGNSTAVSGSKIDSNGVKIAVLSGSWAHATHFTAYRIVNGIEYIGWVNSHGDRYKSSDEGEPSDLCWMPRSIVEQFVATAAGYGPACVVLPESVTYSDTTLYVKTKIPFPQNWRC